jgi:CRISPR/Cas system-associated protein Csx1
MSESQAYTKYLIPLSITISTIFQSSEQSLLPFSNHMIHINETNDINWENYDSVYSSLKQSDLINYEIITRFASKILNESSDIPPEFSKILNEEFWNLL